MTGLTETLSTKFAKMKMIFFGRCRSSSNDDGRRTWVFSLVSAFSRVYVYTQESRDVGLSSCRRRVVASILLCMFVLRLFYHAVYLRLRLFPRTHTYSVFSSSLSQTKFKPISGIALTRKRKGAKKDSLSVSSARLRQRTTCMRP